MGCRELLDDAGTYAEELDGASRKPLCHLTTTAYWEHDEKEGPVSEVHTLQIQRALAPSCLLRSRSKGRWRETDWEV